MGTQEETLTGEMRSRNLISTSDRAESLSPSIICSYAGHKGGVTCVKFRPYMKHLVSGGADGAVLLWGLFCRSHAARHHTQIRPYRFLGHKGEICAVAISPLDTVVASASRDKTIRLWIPTAEGRSTVIRAHSSAVRTIAFSPDGECLLSGGDDKALKIWDVETERFLTGLNGHMNWVRSAEFNSSGRLVVSGGDDKTVRVWDVEKHECTHTYADISGSVTCTRFHPHGPCIGSTSGHAIQIWDNRSKMLIQHYAGNSGIVRTICFHPSGNFLLSTCDDAIVKIWDLREGRILNTIKGHEGGTTCAEFSPTGDHFASGAKDEQIILWQSNLKRIRKPFILGSSLQDNSCITSTHDPNTKQNGKLLNDNLTCLNQEDCSTVSQGLQAVREDDETIEDAEEQEIQASEKDGVCADKLKNDSERSIHEHKAQCLVKDCQNQCLNEMQENSAEEPHKGGDSDSQEEGFQRKLMDRSQEITSHSDYQERQAAGAFLSLEHLINQMGVLTDTVAVFGERLSHMEDKVLKLEKIQKQA